MGRLSEVNLALDRKAIASYAYIAGFLDGDGSIMLQMHRREKGKEVFRVKTVICFYQDSRHQKDVGWIKKTLGCGYIYTRNDHICELRVEGFEKVYEVLNLLQPYLKFKRKQAKLMLELIPKLQHGVKDSVAEKIIEMRKYNYVSHQRKTLEMSP